jgi:3-phosphoshikimate 1-carboxyvinyltransferase
MEITLFSHRDNSFQGAIQLAASKSIASRYLMINAVAGLSAQLSDFSDAEDTMQLQAILRDYFSNSEKLKTYDAGAGGTTFRFLTAFFASRSCKVVLTGTQRMLERPVGELVNALQQLGAKIRYLGKEGFPPLEISGKKLKGGTITINAGISSQFISALMLIAPTFSEGLEIKFSSHIVSRPYMLMTAAAMKEYGINLEIDEVVCRILPGAYRVDSTNTCKPYVEGDWSAASYFYALAALAKNADFSIANLFAKSIQPDAYCERFFRLLGVETEFNPKGIRVHKISAPDLSFIEMDCTDCPDLAQTIAVVCSARKIPVRLTGLSTLRTKETDRVAALQKELFKFNVVSEAGHDYLQLNPENLNIAKSNVVVETYEDHRMAMSFAPLVVMRKKLRIKNPDVVKKSFPEFWNTIATIGISSKNS